MTMNGKYLGWLLMGLLTVGGAALTACDDHDGPVENAGEEIDEAVDNTGDGVEDLGEDIDEAVEN
jgi:hypothetical protein